MKNCYVVIGHPNTPDKFKLLLDNLKSLRKYTDCCIILSLNYFPQGIENWKDELYDYITYSDYNKFFKGKISDLKYTITTDNWDWVTVGMESELPEEGVSIDYGFACNNLYLRGAQLGISLGYDGFIFMNYDVEVQNKKICEKLETSENLFFDSNDNSTTTDKYLNTYCFKSNLDLLKMLEDLNIESIYNNIKYNHEKIGFLETIYYRYLYKKYTDRLYENINIIKINELEEKGYNINFDNHFKGYRYAICPKINKVVLLIEYMHSSADREVSVEFQGKDIILGNMKGRWATQYLTPWYEGMTYTTTVNGKKYKRKIEKHNLERNIITYK
tara:strand:+ start:356 stop:1345 length:990 start_codon:yes stop_codon:yes gene_type:complete